MLQFDDSAQRGLHALTLAELLELHRTMLYLPAVLRHYPPARPVVHAAREIEEVLDDLTREIHARVV